MTERPESRPTLPEPALAALLDSRQRWRDLVTLSCDLAFETDLAGRLIFLSPETVLGWETETLLESPAERLLAAEGEPAGFDPFRASRPVRDRRVWLKRADGALALMSFSAMPLLDAQGVRCGTRGTARDVSASDRVEVAMAAALRRSELIDQVVTHIRTEVLADRMMDKALEGLVNALGADGAMVLERLQAASGAVPDGAILHAQGGDVPSLRALATAELAECAAGPGFLGSPDGHHGMLCATPSRFHACAGLLVWRRPGQRPWDQDDLMLLGAAIAIIRIVLEHGAVQRDMARQARTDLLTGLHNRRAFTEEMTRRLDRLERSRLPGTLLFIDMDNFKGLNDRYGHEAGDEGLRTVAELLRIATRPGDLVARLGGDEFAVWMDGMDDLAAAERADQLCRIAPSAFADLCAEPPVPGLSIGIVTCWPGSKADAGTLLRRADTAMYEVKRSGGARWRVWHGGNDE